MTTSVPSKQRRRSGPSKTPCLPVRWRSNARTFMKTAPQPLHSHRWPRRIGSLPSAWTSCAGDPSPSRADSCLFDRSRRSPVPSDRRRRCGSTSESCPFRRECPATMPASLSAPFGRVNLVRLIPWSNRNVRRGNDSAPPLRGAPIPLAWVSRLEPLWRRLLGERDVGVRFGVPRVCRQSPSRLARLRPERNAEKAKEMPMRRSGPPTPCQYV